MIFCCLLLHKFYGEASSASMVPSSMKGEELGAEEKTLRDLQSKGVGELYRLREEIKDDNRLDRLMSNYNTFFLFIRIQKIIERK